jgi:hypothetical protein
VSGHARRAALGASALGAAYGALCPTWQVAVEPAQVLAGLVRYPETNPNFIYQANTWTVLHQAAAVLLRAGMSEVAASVLFSALVPAAVFAAVALWVCALQPAGEDRSGTWVAALAPFVALGVQELGVHYPVLIAGYEHTYGMAGLAAAILAFGLLAAEAWGAAGFVLAFGPAVHPSLGLWTGLTAALAWPWRDPSLREATRRARRGAIAGAAVAAASLALHFLGSYRRIAIPADERRVYLETFVALWDEHRPPLDPFDWTAMLATVVGVAAAARLLGGPTTRGERLLLRACVAALVVGLGAGLLARAALGVPGLLLTLMPSRFLNLLVLGSVPLAVGWLWAAGPTGRVALAALAAAFATGGLELGTLPRLMAAAVGIAVALHATSWRAALAVAGAAAALALGAALAVGAGFPLDDEARLWLRWSPAVVALAVARAAVPRAPAAQPALARAASALGLAALLLLAGRKVEGAVRGAPERYLVLAEPDADSALTAFARGGGMAALGPDSYLLQLATRRPVLLETGAMDFIPYVPEAGPEVVRILRRLYASDYFRRSDRGLIDAAHVSEVWSQRTTEEWRAVARELGFRDVLVSAGWTLRLPEIARSDRYVLYRVPD